MKLSTIVGILTLVVVAAGIAAALWQLDTGREPLNELALERDLFGAPVPRNVPADQPRTAELDQQSPPDSADVAPSDIPDPLAEPAPSAEPAEPFVPPRITASA